jgi:hypothetical protein
MYTKSRLKKKEDKKEFDLELVFAEPTPEYMTLKRTIKLARPQLTKESPLQLLKPIFERTRETRLKMIASIQILRVSQGRGQH